MERSSSPFALQSKDREKIGGSFYQIASPRFPGDAGITCHIQKIINALEGHSQIPAKFSESIKMLVASSRRD